MSTTMAQSNKPNQGAADSRPACLCVDADAHTCLALSGQANLGDLKRVCLCPCHESNRPNDWEFPPTYREVKILRDSTPGWEPRCIVCGKAIEPGQRFTNGPHHVDCVYIDAVFMEALAKRSIEAELVLQDCGRVRFTRAIQAAVQLWLETFRPAEKTREGD